MADKVNISGIIDIHAHVLPGVDDGSRTMEESVELLHMAYDQGVRSVIATPHYSRRGRNEGYEPLAEELQALMREDYPDFNVYVGQETHYHEDLAQRLKDGKGRTMAGSRYVLVEFDTSSPYMTLQRGMRQVADMGYIPIIAHIERIACLREKGRVNELISCGCKMQMNYESLDGRFFDSEVRWCREQVKEGRIHFLGSDMHRLDFRPPNITGAINWLQKTLDDSEFDRLTRRNPLRIIRHERMD